MNPEYENRKGESDVRSKQCGTEEKRPRRKRHILRNLLIVLAVMAGALIAETSVPCGMIAKTVVSE